MATTKKAIAEAEQAAEIKETIAVIDPAIVPHSPKLIM